MRENKQRMNNKKAKRMKFSDKNYCLYETISMNVEN